MEATANTQLAADLAQRMASLQEATQVRGRPTCVACWASDSRGSCLHARFCAPRCNSCNYLGPNPFLVWEVLDTPQPLGPAHALARAPAQRHADTLTRWHARTPGGRR